MPLPLLTCHGEGTSGMMSHKAWAFCPLPPMMLEDLGPEDHFNWYLERSLD